jgi:hypothetical protein
MKNALIGGISNLGISNLGIEGAKALPLALTI